MVIFGYHINTELTMNFKSQINNTHNYILNMEDIGIKLVMPSDEIMNKVAKDRQIDINGFVLKEGTKIKLRIFDKEFIGFLHFNEKKKMLLLCEEGKEKSENDFNILGYIYHITEINDIIVDVL